MNHLAAPVLSHLNVLGDPLRARLLIVLEGQTLSVGELCERFGLWFPGVE